MVPWGNLSVFLYIVIIIAQSDSKNVFFMLYKKVKKIEFGKVSWEKEMDEEKKN